MKCCQGGLYRKHLQACGPRISSLHHPRGLVWLKGLHSASSGSPRPTRWRHRIAAACELDPQCMPEARPGAECGTALTGNEPHLWRRMTNLARYGNEQGYFMGPCHWQLLVDNTPGVLLHEETSKYNTSISVRQHGDFRALRLSDCLHSVTITESNRSGRAVAIVDLVPFGYARAMAAAAAAFGRLTGAWPGARGEGSETSIQHPAQSTNLAVCLGVGGGTLPALLAHHYYKTLIQAVDIDPVVLDVAERFMTLSAPELMGKQNLWVREGDARVAIADLLESGVQPELILMDCYDAQGRIPADLTGAVFLGACVRALKPGGLLLANLFNNDVGSHARLRFAAFAEQVQDIVGAGNLYSVKAVQQEVNVILVAVKPAEGASAAPFTGQQVAEAAKAAGKEAGFKFNAAAELADLFCVHADSVDTFRETRA